MERLALRVTVHFIRFGLSANQVTLISLFLGLSGCFWMAFGGYWGRLFGLFLLTGWQVLDDVDGHVARTMKTSSKLGEFLDDCGANIMYGSVFLALGVGLALTPEPSLAGVSGLVGIDTQSRVMIVAFGALAALSTALRSLIALRYSIITRSSHSNNEQTRTRSKLKNLRNLYIWTHQNFLEFPGFFVPGLVLASVFGLTSWLLLMYTVLWCLDTVFAFVLHARNLAALDARTNSNSNGESRP